MGEGRRKIFHHLPAVTDLLRFISIAEQLRPLFSRDGKVLESEMASINPDFILTQMRAAASPREWITIGATRRIKNAER